MTDETAASEAKIASEMRHRTANTFQLLSALARMRGQRSTDAETKRQLVWMADAVGALGALERYRNADGVDLKAYLDEMAPVWRRRHGSEAVSFSLTSEAIRAPDQAASTLALIVQELVTNALSHGGGAVSVVLRAQEDDRWELVVTDDGDGFEPAAEVAGGRFGLWFVRSLAAQVRGEFTIECRPGTVARLVFSL